MVDAGPYRFDAEPVCTVCGEEIEYGDRFVIFGICTAMGERELNATTIESPQPTHYPTCAHQLIEYQFIENEHYFERNT